jgi:hypothetical protein
LWKACGGSLQNIPWRDSARWQIRGVLHFDSINEKSQLTKERQYSEERKRGRTLGITKEQ